MKKILAIALYCLANLAFAQSLTITTPGGIDPDSFGRSATYLGQFQTPTVWFSLDCQSVDPVTFNSPDDRCVTVPATPLGVNDPGVNFAFHDLGSMVIPGGSTHSQIWLVIINKLDLHFQNYDANANGIRATFMGSLVITIESEVLNDPSIIDPSTGHPASGKVV